MSLKIEVVGSYIKNVRGTKGDNAGKEFQIPMVEAYSHLPGERYPVRTDYSLAKGQEAPKPGQYVLGAGSFFVDQYGNLGVRRSLELIAVAKAAA